MGREDYPYCIFCDNKIAHLVVRDGAIVYLCTHCGESIMVKADD